MPNEEWFFGVWDDGDGGTEVSPGFKDSRGVFWRATVYDKAPCMMRADGPPLDQLPTPVRGQAKELTSTEIAIHALRNELHSNMADLFGAYSLLASQLGAVHQHAVHRSAPYGGGGGCIHPSGVVRAKSSGDIPF